MQRLFSTFADGAPGAGLLMQRLLVGAALTYCALTTGGGAFSAPHVIGALAGLFLMAGLWTPIAGVVVACVEAWISFSSPDHVMYTVSLGVLAATLALIGPGQWSIDARLYGRKHFVPPEL